MASSRARERSNGRKSGFVRDELLAMLEDLEVGEAIPPERKLASDLGVSRPTLRAVIDELVREGMLLRRHGSGTFVAEPKIALPLTMTSFSEDMARRGMVPSSRVLSFEVIAAGAKLGQKLKVSPTAEVYAVRRLRLADGETMAIETLHLPLLLVPGLEAKDLSGSFYELYRDRYGIAIATATQAIEPTVTNEEESKLLGVPLHSPAFLFERTSREDDGRTVEFVQSVYRGDRYRIVTELQPAAGLKRSS
jgi:GntR family transcriptional regulator